MHSAIEEKSDHHVALQLKKIAGMEATTTAAHQPETLPEYDRKSELKAFDDSKACVKGLVDAGLTKIPRIFIHDHISLHSGLGPGTSRFNLPVIDLAGSRSDIIHQVREACEKWGFFQVINHGIPERAMEEMIEGVRRFHEQDTEVKKHFYSRDVPKSFRYNSNIDLYSAPAANWRDSYYIAMAPQPPHPEELPAVCSDIIIEYSNHVMSLGLTLLELFSESLVLAPNHLKNMGCAEGLYVLCHYYPACPEPDLTLGTSNHTDSGFFTILLQDKMGGLQILHEGAWVDVPPLPGALVVNVTDLLQIITNDKFKSANHRVLAKKVGPRISVTCFFRTHFKKGRYPKHMDLSKNFYQKKIPQSTGRPP